MPNPSTTQEEVVDGVADLVSAFLLRRLKKLQTDISAFLNVNPFMLSALRGVHSFDSITDLSEFLFISHMAAGHATGFGKLVDEKILPLVFGTVKLTGPVREQRNMVAAAYNEIDHIVNPTDPTDWSLLSLKASAWTIQDSMAHNLYASFKQIGDFRLYGKEIVVGVFYGNESLLTNKYSILRGINPRQQEQFVRLNYVRVLAGRKFWSWLNGDETDTQLWVLEGTAEGSVRALEGSPERREMMREAPKVLAAELARKYGLSPTGPVDWETLLTAINDDPALPPPDAPDL